MTVSGDTVVEGNTNVSGSIADIYLQRTVRESDPSKYPTPLQITVHQLTDNASINFCPGLGYACKNFKNDLNRLPLMVLDTGADASTWNNNWLRVDDQDEAIVFDPITEQFICVRNTSN